MRTVRNYGRRKHVTSDCQLPWRLLGQVYAAVTHLFPLNDFWHGQHPTGSDPGIKVNIYQTLSSYTVPGPSVFSCSGGGSTPAPTTVKPSTTQAPTTTSRATTAPPSTTTTTAGTVAQYGQCGGIGYVGTISKKSVPSLQLNLLDILALQFVSRRLHVRNWTIMWVYCLFYRAWTWWCWSLGFLSSTVSASKDHIPLEVLSILFVMHNCIRIILNLFLQLVGISFLSGLLPWKCPS